MEEKFKVTNNITKDMIYDVGMNIFKEDSLRDKLILAILGPCIIMAVVWYYKAINVGIILLAIMEITFICKTQSITAYMYVKKSKELIQKQTILFYEEYLKVQYQHSIEDIGVKYSDIDKVSETEKYFFFKVDEWLLWFDKESSMVEDLDEFRCFIKEKAIYGD